jgi:predicted transcriptional regulator
MKSRDRLLIISLILEIATGAEADDNEKIANIMYNVLVTDPKLKKYWTALVEDDLIRYDSSTQAYKTTEKGLRFLKACNDKLDELSKEDDDDTK